jgi:hypothetical protein
LDIGDFANVLTVNSDSLPLKMMIRSSYIFPFGEMPQAMGPGEMLQAIGPHISKNSMTHKLKDSQTHKPTNYITILLSLIISN